ncbi:unnamed protein product [Moneuplotes crassus]|uniref:Uncharacterized protein n=2 Tax=Euplotes crassus TaxID=5936 RepID=A0AAD1XE00_EUPCR|nr:unnamed protein product [Moneuplotes crassus]
MEKKEFIESSSDGNLGSSTLSEKVREDYIQGYKDEAMEEIRMNLKMCTEYQEFQQDKKSEIKLDKNYYTMFGFSDSKEQKTKSTKHRNRLSIEKQKKKKAHKNKRKKFKKRVQNKDKGFKKYLSASYSLKSFGKFRKPKLSKYHSVFEFNANIDERSAQSSVRKKIKKDKSTIKESLDSHPTKMKKPTNLCFDYVANESPVLSVLSIPLITNESASKKIFTKKSNSVIEDLDSLMPKKRIKYPALPQKLPLRCESPCPKRRLSSRSNYKSRYSLYGRESSASNFKTERSYKLNSKRKSFAKSPALCASVHKSKNTRPNSTSKLSMKTTISSITSTNLQSTTISCRKHKEFKKIIFSMKKSVKKSKDFNKKKMAKQIQIVLSD